MFNLNQKGMSTLLIMTILALGFSSMAVSLAARQNQELHFLFKEVEKEHLEDFLVRIRITLEGKSNCVASFGSQSLPGYNQKEEITILLPEPDRRGQVILSKSNHHLPDGTFIEASVLVKASNSKTKFGLYHLQVKGQTNRVPAQYFNYTVPVYAITDATTGKVTNCYSTMFIDDEKKLTIEDKVCNTRFNSTNKYRFDAKINTCVQELYPDETGGMVL